MNAEAEVPPLDENPPLPDLDLDANRVSREMWENLEDVIRLGTPDRQEELKKILEEGTVEGTFFKEERDPATGATVAREMKNLLDFSSPLELEAAFDNRWNWSENTIAYDEYFFKNSSHLLRVVLFAIYVVWRLLHSGAGDKVKLPNKFSEIQAIRDDQAQRAKVVEHHHKLSLYAYALAFMKSFMPDEDYKTIIKDVALALAGALLVEKPTEPPAPSKRRKSRRQRKPNQLARFRGTTGRNAALFRALDNIYQWIFEAVPVKRARDAQTEPDLPLGNGNDDDGPRNKRARHHDDQPQNATPATNGGEPVAGENGEAVAHPDEQQNKLPEDYVQPAWAIEEPNEDMPAAETTARTPLPEAELDEQSVVWSSTSQVANDFQSKIIGAFQGVEFSGGASFESGDPPMGALHAQQQARVSDEDERLDRARLGERLLEADIDAVLGQYDDEGSNDPELGSDFSANHGIAGRDSIDLLDEMVKILLDGEHDRQQALEFDPHVFEHEAVLGQFEPDSSAGVPSTDHFGEISGPTESSLLNEHPCRPGTGLRCVAVQRYCLSTREASYFCSPPSCTTVRLGIQPCLARCDT